MSSATPERLLLCCDLDRTLLPNGDQPESAHARPLLRAICALPEVSLCFVSGRDLNRLQQAMLDFQLPTPDYAIGDVGSSLYHIQPSGWQSAVEWQNHIAADWNGHRADHLQAWLADIDGLTPQEASKQGPWKLSYYTAADIDQHALKANIQRCLSAHGISANVIWSLDETGQSDQPGLLDILPPAANKLHAIRFLTQQLGLSASQTVFAGDSGNDLDVLESDIPGVLVANAIQPVRDQAIARSHAAGTSSQLYLAGGGWAGMNGNYSAGVIEGLSHYHPRFQATVNAALAAPSA